MVVYIIRLVRMTVLESERHAIVLIDPYRNPATLDGMEPHPRHVHLSRMRRSIERGQDAGRRSARHRSRFEPVSTHQSAGQPYRTASIETEPPSIPSTGKLTGTPWKLAPRKDINR